MKSLLECMEEVQNSARENRITVKNDAVMESAVQLYRAHLTRAATDKLVEAVKELTDVANEIYKIVYKD